MSLFQFYFKDESLKNRDFLNKCMELIVYKSVKVFRAC